MRTNRLGHTGLYVSELCLGTMTFGGTGEVWSKMGGLPQPEAERLIGQALDGGINFIDTADVYSNGLAEEFTGQSLRNLATPRDSVVVATKGYGAIGQGPNAGGNSRHHLISAVKASLKRLQLDHVDLYQLHGFDPATPIEETVAALDILVQHGHVRYVGASNWAAWQVVKALGIADRTGAARFACLQAYYTVAGRDLEREIVPMLRSEGLGLMVWSPLAGGLLSGKYAAGPDADGRRGKLDFPPVAPGHADAALAAMRPIAEAHGVPMARVALAWLLHRKIVTSVIIGAKRPDQLQDNLAATTLDLTAAELDTLDAAAPPAPEYPGWMFAAQSMRARQLAEPGRLTAR